MIRTIREGDTWNLQTAVIGLRHPATGRRVTLIATIHIGRPDYYTRLTELVEEHEQQGLVLFEGVGELTQEEAAALPDEERRVYESLASLNGAYRRLAAALDLVAQPDVMPRPRAGWVRADLPVRELLRRWVSARLPLVPVMEAVGQVIDSALMRRAARFVLLQEPLLLSAFRLVKGWTPGVGRLAALLVDERNAAALDVFDSVDHGQDVAIIYGAGHVPGLLEGLTRRGYREITRDWFTAHTERIPFSDVLDRVGPWFRAGARG